MEHYINSATNSVDGRPLSGATVSVFNAGTSTLSTIYSDNGVTPKGNPTTTDSLGAFDFYAADGLYDISIAKTGYSSVELTDVAIDDSFSSVNFAGGSAASPGLAVSGDNDTGLYSPGPNQIGIALGGVSRMAIASSGAATYVLAPSAAGFAGRWATPYNGEQFLQVDNQDAGPLANAQVRMDTDAGYARVYAVSTAGGASSVLESNMAGGLYVLSNHAAGPLSLGAYGAVRGVITATVLNLASGMTVSINSVQVFTSRRTGWGAPTGTATRTTFATGSVTLSQLAERVKALIDDLTTHGLIGA